MKWLLVYLVIGIAALRWTMRYAKNKNVTAEVADGLYDIGSLGFILALWPIFVVNDIFVEIPKRIEDKEKSSPLDFTSVESEPVDTDNPCNPPENSKNQLDD